MFVITTKEIFIKRPQNKHRSKLLPYYETKGSEKMNIIIVDERTNKTKTVAFNGKTVKDVLQTLKINQETVLVVRNNEVLTSNENLNDKDKIELLSVISGG